MNKLAAQIARATIASISTGPLDFVMPHVAGPDGREVPAFDVLASEHRMALIGEWGTGKTTLMHGFGRTAADSYLAGIPDARAPILVHGARHDLSDGIAAVLRDLDIDVPPRELSRLLNSDEIVLLIDGVDEMPDGRLGAFRIANILHQYPKLAAVVATRPGAFGAELSALTSYTIAPYSKDQAAALILAFALADGAAVERFLAFLQRANLPDAARNPLFAKLLWEASDGGSAPFGSTADLFNDLLDEGLRQATGSGEDGLSAEQLLALLGEMAVTYHVSGWSTASAADIPLELPGERLTIDRAKMIEQLVATRFVRVDEGQLSFVHSSFVEFMVARWLHASPSRLIEALEFGETSVEEILCFAAGLADEVAPIVELLLQKDRVLDAVTCLRFARVENDALSAYVALRLGGHIGQGFIQRLVQQLPPALDYAEDADEDRASPGVHDKLLRLLDDACDMSRPNHERGKRFESFSEALFDGPFEPVHRNFRSEHGELDLIMEVRGGAKFWDFWGPDIFVECKNLSRAVEAHQVHTFISKVEAPRLKLGFLVSVNGFTEDAYAAFRNVARGENRPLVVPISGDQIRQMLQRRGLIELFFKDRIRDVRYDRKYLERT